MHTQGTHSHIHTMNNNQFKSFIELDMSHHIPGANTHSTHSNLSEKRSVRKKYRFSSIFWFFNCLTDCIRTTAHLALALTLKSIPKHLSFFSLSFCPTQFLLHFNFQFPNELRKKKSKLNSTERKTEKESISMCLSVILGFLRRECASNQL